MSRIFDALQRSGTEQSGVEYEDMVSMATVFESQRQPASSSIAVEELMSPAEEVSDASPVSEISKPALDDISASLSRFLLLWYQLNPQGNSSSFHNPRVWLPRNFVFSVFVCAKYDKLDR